MQYTVNRLEKGKVEIKMDVPKGAFEEAYVQVLNELGKGAKIAGFRPGNAPRDVIERHVGASKILNETASFLISKHLSDILKKEDLVPLDSPKIAIGTLAASSPFSFTASFTLKPNVKPGDWKKIKVAKVKVKEITEKDIDESIKNIHDAWQKQQASKGTEVTDEPEEPKETGLSNAWASEDKKFIYDAHGNKIFLKDEPKVTKEPKELKVDNGSPSNASDKIDDNFAKAIGARDLAHLRELVKRDLETIVGDQVEAKLEQEVFEEILKIAEVEVPDILVEDELNRILVRLSSELERGGSDLEKYLAEQRVTIDELKAKWKPQAEKNVKITLVMDEIGRSEEVKVSREEIDQAIRGVNQTNLTTDQKADLERYLALSIFQAKTLERVKKTVAA